MDVKKFLLENGIAPKRSMDQHFLVDKGVLDKEVELAELNKNDVVLEVGAGVGNLTEKIAARCKVIAIEKDGRFAPFLKRIGNAEIISTDALGIIRNLSFNKIISNIPYSISQPLLLALLKQEWDAAVLIVQKEFAEKIASGTKLAVLVNDCCDFSIEYFVSGDSFYPPAPDSAIVVLKQRKLMDERFWKFLCRIYAQKNRNVKNVAKNCPVGLAGRKVHQLGAEELKTLYELNKQ